MHIRLSLAALVLVSAPATAGMYSQAWSEVEAADRSDVRKEFTPAISQIDGKSTRNTRRPDPVDPGKHRVTIRFETGRVVQSPAEMVREVEMDLEPCVRYKIAARRTEGTNWEPKVYSEPIGECAKKFKKPV